LGFIIIIILVFFEGGACSRHNGKMASPSLFMNADPDHDDMDIRPTWEAETIERQQPVNCEKIKQDT